jgi:hypothetical protein
MGVYSREWMEMLIAGGMSYHSARKLTGRLSKIITECRGVIWLRNGMSEGRERRVD